MSTAQVRQIKSLESQLKWGLQREERRQTEEERREEAGPDDGRFVQNLLNGLSPLQSTSNGRHGKLWNGEIVRQGRCSLVFLGCKSVLGLQSPSMDRNIEV